MEQTSTDPKLAPPEPTLADIKESMWKWWREPRMIGTLPWASVWVNPEMPLFNVEFRDLKTKEVLLRVSVDHPNLKGTKIEQAARAALGL